jgi:hypothetical protein
MNKLRTALRGTALSGAIMLAPFLGQSAFAQTSCPAGNAAVPPGANTGNPAAPFYIDTSGLDFNTSPPTRDPFNPEYPRATALPGSQLPAPTAIGNFIIGAKHPAAPETVVHSGVRQGTVYTLTMSSADSVVYKPGLIRDDPDNCLDAAIYAGHTAAGDPSNMLVPSSHAGIWTRPVDVYVPAGYVRGTPAPFMVAGDGGANGFFHDQQFFTVLNNLIAEHRIPPIIAISIGAGGQDAQGSERGREYDTVSGAYAEWVETEVLPLVEKETHVRLTKDPDGRATLGISSSGAAAFTMAWFHPELYHRVLAYSPTMVNQQWPHNPALPGGAWQYHDAWAGPAVAPLVVNGTTVTEARPGASLGAPLIPNSPTKPIRYWFETGDRDLFYPDAPMADGMHDWARANEDMARVLAAKGYQYQFVFSRNAGHVDAATVAQTLPEALEFVWYGYKPEREAKLPSSQG